MTINRIQNQTTFTQRPVEPQAGNVAMERFIPLPKKHYRHFDDIPDTVNSIRPEQGQGRLLSSNVFNTIPRFFANRYYDIKSVIKGYNGTANDHQLGRTNDVGLILGGLGIASFLTTKRVAALPKHMEFIGLGSFLTSMALWPKLAIWGPARAVHGFDVDKRYIDDQGRNKSVFQDPNYIPFDLYNGKRKSEDLSAIGDYMGIAKNAPNREEMVKDQMRKIAIQNNTLWMLTSGFAVPTMTALISCGLEKLYAPVLLANQTKKSDKLMEGIFAEVINGATPAKETKPYNVVSAQMEKFTLLPENKALKIITQTELDNFVNAITKDAGKGVSAALSADIKSLMDTSNKGKAVVDEAYLQELAKNIEAKFQGHKHLKKGILTFEEISNAVSAKFGGDISKGILVDTNALLEVLSNKGQQKLANVTAEAHLGRVQEMFNKAIMAENAELLPKSEKLALNEETAGALKKLSEPLEKYLFTFKRVKDANSLIMGDIEGSKDAVTWGKLEKMFTECIFPKASLNKLKVHMDNPKALEAAIKSQFEKIAANKEEFEKTIKQINELKMSYLKDVLGEGNEGKYVDLIIGKHNDTYANWNSRTFVADGTKVDRFIELQTRMANDFRAALYEKNLNNNFGNLMKKVAGVGADMKYSVANLEVNANVAKVENFVTACDRIIHSLDVYRRAHLYGLDKSVEHLGGTDAYINKDWVSELFEMGKKYTIAAQSNDVYAKFGTERMVRKYQSYMNLIYNFAKNEDSISIYGKGYLDPATLNVLGENSASANTIQHWINKYRNIIGNDDANWRFAEFRVGSAQNYNDLLKTQGARYRLQGKNIVELLDQGVKKSYNGGKWMKMFAGLFTGVLGVSIISQFFFGSKDWTIPLEKDRLRAERKAARMGGNHAN